MPHPDSEPRFSLAKAWPILLLIFVVCLVIGYYIGFDYVRPRLMG